MFADCSLHAPMFITYYITLFRMGTDRRNSILMYFLLLVEEKIIILIYVHYVLGSKTSVDVKHEIIKIEKW